MPVKKLHTPPSEVKTEKTTALSVSVYDLTGKEAGKMSLPEAIFGQKVNTALLAQAIRVYQNNLSGHFAHTKTRGEVKGSTRKIYKQKGTGGARHGSNRAPIFVGGGIALGPRSRKVTLDLPKKMKKAALISALSLKMGEKAISGISGLEKLTGKTREMAKFLKNSDKRSVLIVTGENQDLVTRSLSNLPDITSIAVGQLNTLEVLKYQALLFTKEALSKMEKGETK